MGEDMSKISEIFTKMGEAFVAAAEKGYIVRPLGLPYMTNNFTSPQARDAGDYDEVYGDVPNVPQGAKDSVSRKQGVLSFGQFQKCRQHM